MIARMIADLAAAAAALMTLTLHPAHETYAEIQWNAVTGRTEIAWRLDPLDEQAIMRSIAGDDVAAKRQQYLARNFRLGTDPQTLVARDVAVTVHWVGSERRRGRVWWYFEIEPTGDVQTPPTWVMIRVPGADADHRDRYTHRVTNLADKTTVTIRDRPVRLTPGKTSEDPSDDQK